MQRTITTFYDPLVS